MDYARRIGKSDEPRRQIWKQRCTAFPANTSLVSGDTYLSEDRRLVNWKRWLADRKRQSRRVEAVTGRSRIDQLHNSSETFRAFVEMKELMEAAVMPVPAVADKYRGGPEFWRVPEFLSDRGDPSLPKVSLTFTRKDLNLTPDLTRVGLPDLTAIERDLVGLRVKREPWRCSEYLKARKLQLAKEIALLLPKEPETATLAVQGRAFRRKELRKKWQPGIPPITATQPDEEEPYEDAEQAAVLKIQDREFVWQRSFLGTTDGNPITWSLIFKSNTDERVEKEVVLENRGTRVIVYHWRDSSFRSIHMSFQRRGSPFFFNKTKGLLLPGQIARIKVWYRSHTRGVFTESWRLVTEPRLSPSAFVFRFWGCAVDDRNAELADHRTIDEYLDRCVRDATIRFIIEEIMAGVKYSEPPEPPYTALFLQSELFGSLNPRYFYHPSIVSQLREMYRDVTDGSASLWNLSLDILRDILLQIKETKRRRDMLARFNDLCKQCLRPNLYGVTRDNKSDAVYSVLCAFANLFEDESEFTKNNSLMREELVTASKANLRKSTSLLQKSTNNSRGTLGAESIDRSQSMQVREEKSFNLNLQPYKEAFFIRTYKALEEAVERACAIVDSFNRLNQPNK